MKPQQINTLRERFFEDNVKEIDVMPFDDEIETHQTIWKTPEEVFEWFISQPELNTLRWVKASERLPYRGFHAYRYKDENTYGTWSYGEMYSENEGKDHQFSNDYDKWFDENSDFQGIEWLEELSELKEERGDYVASQNPHLQEAVEKLDMLRLKYNNSEWPERILYDIQQLIFKGMDYVASSNNTNQASVASHSCTDGNSIERFQNQVLEIINENLEAMKRAKAGNMPIEEIFETDDIYEAVINDNEDLFTIISGLYVGEQIDGKEIEQISDEDLQALWTVIGGSPHLFEYGKDELKQVLTTGECGIETEFQGEYKVEPIGLQLDFYTMAAIVDTLRQRGYGVQLLNSDKNDERNATQQEINQGGDAGIKNNPQ